MFWSLLLYGPPGTGKTEFAEELCTALGWPLISVTPSDFIRGGESQVEERAKMVFDVLGAQADAVVLLDEIDRMLLDRDSEEYGAQSDIFQFMTPSMLTKLRELRKAERVVFLIATNFAERIDPAAKRPGRIDAHVLVAPPDRSAREKMLRGFLAERERKWESSAPKAVRDAVGRVAGRTPLMVFTELKQLFEAAAARADRDFTRMPDLLADELKKVKPAISLLSYESRFLAKAAASVVEGSRSQRVVRSPPFEEFLLLLYLRTEAQQELEPPEEEVCRIVFSELVKRAGTGGVRALLHQMLDSEKVAGRLAKMSPRFAPQKAPAKRNA